MLPRQLFLGTSQSVECTPGCMRALATMCIPSTVGPNSAASKLDELHINAIEKDIMALTLIALMSDQFIGCPLSRPIVPRDPSPRDLELLTVLDLASLPPTPKCAAPIYLRATVSPQAFSFAQNAWVLRFAPRCSSTCRTPTAPP